MQLSLDRGGLLRLCPRGHLTGRADELDLELALETEDVDGDTPIEVVARVCHVRRLSQFEYRLGVEFLEFSEESAVRQFARLEKFLETTSKPAGGRSESLECNS